MLELLFLLLPVAAAYGWYMGRRSAQQNKQDEANRLSRDYVAGVNFLLSNQQDKIKCVMTPQGWVTVSVTQKAAFSSQLCSPGCQRQPEIHTATGMTSNSAAPTAVRLAIERMASPF